MCSSRFPYVQQTGSYEYARFWNIKQQNDGVTDKTQYFSREAIEAYRTGSDPIMYPERPVKDKMFNGVFLQTKNNINISEVAVRTCVISFRSGISIRTAC